MKKYTLLFLIARFAVCPSMAQTGKVYSTIDLSHPAHLSGAYGEITRYFAARVGYPAGTSTRPTGNRLILSFVVEPDGSASDLRMYETPGPAFTEAVLKAFDGLKWIPAEANGHPVRQVMVLYFLYHHVLRKVTVREGYGEGLEMGGYDLLSALQPADYGKINFPTSPFFMGYYPEDSLKREKQYPEAARAAGVQGDVRAEYTVQPDGSLSDIALTYDPGYGMGAEALRLLQLKKAWIPAQVFDSTYAVRREATFEFCPDPSAIEASDRLYAEGELAFPASFQNTNIPRPKGYVFYEADYELGRERAAAICDGGVVAADFTVEKDGTLSNIRISGAAAEKYDSAAQKLLRRYPWRPAQACSRPCRMQLRRYLCFRQGYRDERNCCLQNQIFLTAQNPGTTPGLLPPVNYDTIYEPADVDRPALYKTGPRSITQCLLLHWPEYRTGIPAGAAIQVQVLISEQGDLRKAKLLRGLGTPVDDNILEVVKTLQNWTPAYKNGHPVRSWQLVEIRP